MVRKRRKIKGYGMLRKSVALFLVFVMVNTVPVGAADVLADTDDNADDVLVLAGDTLTDLSPAEISEDAGSEVFDSSDVSGSQEGSQLSEIQEAGRQGAVPDKPVVTKPVKGVTADGWEYELKEITNGSSMGISDGWYVEIKSYKGRESEVVIPATIIIYIEDEAGNSYQLSYPTLLRGGNKTRTKFPADIKSISFEGGNTVTSDISYLFSGYKDLENVDLSGLNTSGVTNMSYMFMGCTSIKRLDSANGLNISNVTNFEGMFKNCSSLYWLEFAGDGYTVGCTPTNVSSMFQGCSGLYFLSLSRMSFAALTAKTSKNLFTGTTKLTTIWTPLYIPASFRIPLAGTYAVSDINRMLSQVYPRTTDLGPVEQNVKYVLSKRPPKTKEDPEEGPGEKPVESVNLNMGHKVFEHGSGKVGRDVLVCDVFPRDAGIKTVVWNSSNTKVVKVVPIDDESCEMITTGPGFADVTVTTLDGGYSATCSVTVKKYTDFIEESTGDEDGDHGGSVNYELVAGQSYDLYKYLDEYGVFEKLKKDKKCFSDFKILSTNPGAVKVDNSGMTEEVGAGLAFLAQTYKDHGKPRQSTIAGTKIRVWKPSFMCKTVNLAYVGQAISGMDNIDPRSCPIYPTSWASSKESVATVDPSGNITATGKGNTKISVTWTNDQGSSAVYSFSIKVGTPKLSTTTMKLMTGESGKLTLSGVPKDAKVVWKLTDYGGTGRSILGLENGSGNVVSIKPNKKGTACSIVGELPGDVFVTAIVDGNNYDCYVEVPRPELEITPTCLKVKNTKLPANAFHYSSLSPQYLKIGSDSGIFFKGQYFPDFDEAVVNIQAEYTSASGSPMIVLPIKVRTYTKDGKKGVEQHVDLKPQ